MKIKAHGWGGNSGDRPLAYSVDIDDPSAEPATLCILHKTIDGTNVPGDYFRVFPYVPKIGITLCRSCADLVDTNQEYRNELLAALIKTLGQRLSRGESRG